MLKKQNEKTTTQYAVNQSIIKVIWFFKKDNKYKN